MVDEHLDRIAQSQCPISKTEPLCLAMETLVLGDEVVGRVPVQRDDELVIHPVVGPILGCTEDPDRRH
jgi:hypothetical protein